MHIHHDLHSHTVQVHEHDESVENYVRLLLANCAHKKEFFFALFRLKRVLSIRKQFVVTYFNK